MGHSAAGWYSERLEEEQEQLDAVNDALDALDMSRFQVAARRINNREVGRRAERIGALKEIDETLDTLEALAGFLRERVEYLTPLARLERQMIEQEQHREYLASL